MAKRKKLTKNDRKHFNVDCSLNDIIGGHLKKLKFEKNLKLFEEKAGQTKKTKMLKKFFDFLKEKELEKDNIKNEDLGFEINFGAYQPDKKVSIIQLVILVISLYLRRTFVIFLLSYFSCHSRNRIDRISRRKENRRSSVIARKRRKFRKNLSKKLQNLG